MTALIALASALILFIAGFWRLSVGPALGDRALGACTLALAAGMALAALAARGGALALIDVAIGFVFSVVVIALAAAKLSRLGTLQTAIARRDAPTGSGEE